MWRNVCNRASIKKLKAFADESNFRDPHFHGKTRQLELHPHRKFSYGEQGFRPIGGLCNQKVNLGDSSLADLGVSIGLLRGFRKGYASSSAAEEIVSTEEDSDEIREMVHHLSKEIKAVELKVNNSDTCEQKLAPNLPYVRSLVLGEAGVHENQARRHRFMENTKRKTTLNESPIDDLDAANNKQKMQKLSKKNDCGFSRSRVSQFITAHILASQRRLKLLRSNFMQMLQEEGSGSGPSLCEVLSVDFKGWKGNAMVWDMLAFTYSRLEMVQDALYVIAKMKALNVQPSVLTYNSLLYNLRHSDMMWDVYNDMIKSGIHESKQTNSILVDGLCKQSSMQEAVSLLRGIDVKGSSPNVASFNTVMSSFSKMGFVDIAQSVFCLMLKLGVHPDAYSYNILINGLCVAGSVEDALKWTDDMKKHGVEPNEVTYNTLVTGFRVLGLISGATEMIRQTLKKGTNPGNIFMHRAVLSGLCGRRSISEARAYFDVLTSDDVIHDIVLYNIMIDGYAKIGLTRETIRLYNQIIEKGINPTIVTFNSLIYGFCRTRQITEAMRSFDGIRDHGLVPTVITYTTLMNFLCEEGNTRAMLELMTAMEASAVEPTHVTYTVLIKSLCKQRKLQECLLQLDNMCSKGLYPDEVTYNILIQCFCKAREIAKAFRLHNEMISRSLKPDAVTYNILINGLCVYGELQDADMLFLYLREHDIGLKKAAYMTLAKAHCVKGDAQRAMTLFFEMGEMGFEVTVRDYSAAINRLCKRCLTNEAKVFFSMMLSHGISPDLRLYTVMMHAFRLVGDFQSVLEFLPKMVKCGLDHCSS